jgi:hypothetical protein
MAASTKYSIWRLYGVAWLLSILILLAVGIRGGVTDLSKVLILAALEITFSFDNAVVNARVLSTMSRFWQTLFMTAGIIVAVFAVRIFLPILLVALTAKLSIGSVMHVALHNPTQYATHLNTAHPLIAAFGGVFLFMIFLDFMTQDRPVQWIDAIEKRLARLARIRHINVAIGMVVLVLADLAFGASHQRRAVFLAGLIGMVLYLIMNAIGGDEETPKLKQGASQALKAGMIGFLYLELIDASFSLDGVIGAFAITDKIVLIAAGLGIGALYVRALTVHMLRRGTLATYKYLEHGAHYAIGILAICLLVSIRYEVPELVTGLGGLLFIGAALVHSQRENVMKSTTIADA